jgi:hypothetical protein
MTCNTCNKEKNTDDMMGRDMCKDCWNKKEIDFVYYNPKDFEGTLIGEGSVVFFGKENRVAFTIVDGKLDIEVTGEITEAAKMFLDKVKGMMVK